MHPVICATTDILVSFGYAPLLSLKKHRPIGTAIRLLQPDRGYIGTGGPIIKAIPALQPRASIVHL